MDQKDGFLRESTGECLPSALTEAIHQADRSAANTLFDTGAAEHGSEHSFIGIPGPVLKKNWERMGIGQGAVLNG